MRFPFGSLAFQISKTEVPRGPDLLDKGVICSTCIKMYSSAILTTFRVFSLSSPLPFCILDEVDAPLDDANIGKFTQMIRKFSKESQFIIVTHNKMTMASVDVIYGVTMQEAGVSKLVPVDFRGLEHELVN